jgi:hypothetical protein
MTCVFFFTKESNRSRFALIMGFNRKRDNHTDTKN